MHRQCALLDKVPEGFWACFSCQRQPTVDSAIRQVLHKHSESGLSKEHLLRKVRQCIPVAKADAAELSKGLEQALNHANVSFDHDYKVVMRGNRYYLVKTTAADASTDHQLLPDSDDDSYSSESSETLRSEDDVPNPHRRVRRRVSPSSQRAFPANPITVEGSFQEGPDREQSHHATADSGTASNRGRQGNLPSPQKGGVPDHTDYSQGGVLKAPARKSVAVRQEFCGRVEQFGTGKSAAASSRGTSHSPADSANLQAPKLMAQTKTEHEQSSHAIEPLACNMQTCTGSAKLLQLQQQQQPQQQQQQPQQQQGSSLDVSENLAIAHSCVCSALAGLGRFHAYSAAKQEAPGDTTPADQELSAQGVESDAAHPNQVQQAASSGTHALCAPLPSAEDPGPGVAHFLSIMSENDVQIMSLQQRRSRVSNALSQLVELSRYAVCRLPYVCCTY
ncbi:hypothetical protein ABBQ38_013961 [Trebouxia sp. C0009 RCD-2024]